MLMLIQCRRTFQFRLCSAILQFPKPFYLPSQTRQPSTIRERQRHPNRNSSASDPSEDS